MGLFNRFARVLARETAKEYSKSPGQREADKLGQELGEKLEFVETMTQEQYEELMKKERTDTDDLFEKADKECRRICDRVYDCYNDFQNGRLPRLEMIDVIDKARTELKECANLSTDRNGHNLNVIESAILPAKQWIDEVEQKISRR